MKKLILIIITLIIFSCNNAPDPHTGGRDTIPEVLDTAKVVTDTAKKIKVDTAIIHPDPALQKKSAILGYSYFSHMRQDETRNIYAHVLSVNNAKDINRLAETIQLNLQEANNQVKPERRSDTASYFVDQNIFFYKYLTITLSDPDNNFKIDSLGISPKQLIDTVDNNLWQWAVTPKTSTKNARLVLKVAAEKGDGISKPIDTREIAINIQLETNFWRTLITWLRTNPEKLLVLILIPLAAYFGKKIFESKKLNKDKPKE